MDLQTPINIAAALATIAGFGYGIAQQRRANRLAVTEHNTAAARAESLKAARTGVYWAAESVDSLIQRSKNPQVTIVDLAEHARTVRAQLRLLDIQLLQAQGEKAQPLTHTEEADLGGADAAHPYSSTASPPPISPASPSTHPRLSSGDPGAYFPPPQPPPA